jgi:hypothetical protein
MSLTSVPIAILASAIGIVAIVALAPTPDPSNFFTTSTTTTLSWYMWILAVFAVSLTFNLIVATRSRLERDPDMHRRQLNVSIAMAGVSIILPAIMLWVELLNSLELFG